VISSFYNWIGDSVVTTRMVLASFDCLSADGLDDVHAAHLRLAIRLETTTSSRARRTMS